MLVKDEVNDPKIRRIAEEAISWAFQHGLVVASGTETAGQVFHAPIALYTTPFPRDVFEFAK